MNGSLICGYSMTCVCVLRNKPPKMPVASARPNQNPRAMASQTRPDGPWPTGARWRVLYRTSTGSTEITDSEELQRCGELHSGGEEGTRHVAWGSDIVVVCVCMWDCGHVVEVGFVFTFLKYETRRSARIRSTQAESNRAEPSLCLCGFTHTRSTSRST